MYVYAQTNIQLFNQLRDRGYSNAELQEIFNAYQLTIELFTGQFRASGKTFIAHLVGTASILTHLRVSSKLIAAGLLHAAYSQGDFGGIGKPEIPRQSENEFEIRLARKSRNTLLDILL
ncbi:MAG: hypothetical protein HC763_20665 [Hydrococcus sp. CRU_1_1]|nr:hypothetical protein [Hydrococcus sp. CRU_1_1]